MEQKKKTWTDYRKEEAILSNKIIAKKLYASNQDKTMMYNELYREKDLEFVISKVKFLREEPAFVPILEKLAEKHGMTYYDTAFMMFCSFRAVQDPFESLTSIRIADHFHPYFKMLPYMQAAKVLREMHNRFEHISDAITREAKKDYFYQMKFMRIIGLKIMQYFHEINRFKKMGMRKKVTPNSKRILNLYKNRHS